MKEMLLSSFHTFQITCHSPSDFSFVVFGAEKDMTILPSFSFFCCFSEDAGDCSIEHMLKFFF